MADAATDVSRAGYEMTVMLRNYRTWITYGGGVDPLLLRPGTRGMSLGSLGAGVAERNKGASYHGHEQNIQACRRAEKRQRGTKTKREAESMHSIHVQHRCC